MGQLFKLELVFFLALSSFQQILSNASQSHANYTLEEIYSIFLIKSVRSNNPVFIKLFRTTKIVFSDASKRLEYPSILVGRTLSERTGCFEIINHFLRSNVRACKSHHTPVCSGTKFSSPGGNLHKD